MQQTIVSCEFCDASEVRQFHRRLDDFQETLTELEADAPAEVPIQYLEYLREIMDTLDSVYPSNSVQGIIDSSESRRMKELREQAERRRAGAAQRILTGIRRETTDIEASIDSELLG